MTTWKRVPNRGARFIGDDEGMAKIRCMKRVEWRVNENYYLKETERWQSEEEGEDKKYVLIKANEMRAGVKTGRQFIIMMDPENKWIYDVFYGGKVK